MVRIFDMPPEVILHILSYLDLPDLACLAPLSPLFTALATDPTLHKYRLHVVAPSRVSHSLFGQSPGGIPLRPTLPDLVRRGVLRGLELERRWRMGMYLASRLSVVQFESSQKLLRRHARSKINAHLKRRLSTPSHPFEALYQTHIFPDVESSSISISRRLLPVVHNLKWSLKKDELARVTRNGGRFVGFPEWLATRGQGIIHDSERVRLALCPDVKRMACAYEEACH
ncbi:hypothetical protein CYLTODRAFT_416851 [Cylindrobasidium torrendii FP15055 ss-10]|uniref:F-box domain-containing protein n=1 Tax=Cylindrobasidium torrendii FP15055 ss-10 TaxID=1314674 RepID=A0A0D7BSF8_9AGAR|nr:hypothetical protein CYLTODRAFT_416851 [Cylindrobasidium torrendii FP15055 ss-10]